MSELTLERRFAAPQHLVFDFVTRPENLVKWWGHVDWTIVEQELDFTRTGPWHSFMLSDEGNRYDLSGEVTEVSPPDRIRFTWAWHNAAGTRGHESEVTFTVVADGEASRFILHHTGLSDDDTARSHEAGWTAVLRRLERHFPD